ncbi:hypothetical protein SOVF_144740 [Spinacia oleracea]|nr:hypothetical protein SOVF_144740 [Spinacia oleracea]
MSLICIIFFVLSFVSLPFSGAGENVVNPRVQTYIVRIENDFKPAAYFDVVEWYSSILNNVGFNVNQKDGGKSSSHFLHVYGNAFHGFSVRLTSKQAQLLKSQHSVLGVFPDKVYHLQTTRTPHFLGLDSYNEPVGLLKESDLGSDVVIGFLDSGIWPESPSFTDEGLSSVPSHFKGGCDGGVDFPSSLCNKKIVGAKYFSKGMLAMEGVNEEEHQSARDNEGHGTHTASTAAGRGLNASFFGYAEGRAIGIAPKARLAIYKVCWKNGCVASDILAGLDKAVQDGVDIISLSLGSSPTRYSTDPISIGCFAAVEKGIFVSASAGNSGPEFKTVSNIAPWITTVGASTVDRTFPADLVLGNGINLTGASLYTGEPMKDKQFFPITDLGGSACEADDLNREFVKGKIVICLRGSISSIQKGLNVKEAGGLGIVIANDDVQGESLKSDPHLVPGLSITKSSYVKLVEYLNSTRDPKATIVFHGTKVGSSRAPEVAAFSSRGPHFESIYLLKPDIIAPGVDILAAWPYKVPPSGMEPAKDPRNSWFNIISGTSMSCPHVSGIAALIKGAHSDWSPAMIRSALMTTSYNHYRDGKPLVDQQYADEASIWVTGAGHVDPEKANDPGLAYDLGVDSYVDFLCACNYTEGEIRTIARRAFSCDKRTLKQWELNYPAIILLSHLIVESNTTELIVPRTLTNVGMMASSYTAIISSPKGTNVTVSPPKLTFKAKGEKQNFMVKFSTMNVPYGNEEGGISTSAVWEMSYGADHCRPPEQKRVSVEVSSSPKCLSYP